MAKKIAWGITGAGDLLPECFEAMVKVKEKTGANITAILSKAGIAVLKYYKLTNKLHEIADRVLEEKNANTPFVVAALQTGKYDAFVVAPLTANSTAKIALGLADTLITNAVAQANKANIPIYVLPVDQHPGSITTIMPSGGELVLTMRPVDLKNTDRLRRMPGIEVLATPQEIENIPAFY